MRLSVIVPVHNSGDDVRTCLGAPTWSLRPSDQMVVVNDASTDGSADPARSLGAQVTSLEVRARGPAFARDGRAEVAGGDALVFVDADVVMHADALASIEGCPIDGPRVAALLGLHDDDPSGWALVSLCRNLLRRYTQDRGKREASTLCAVHGA